MNENYKGSPFINIGPQVQKEHFEKPIDPNYNGPHPSHQLQYSELDMHYKTRKIEKLKAYYENRYDSPLITNEGYKVVIKDYIDATHILIEFIHSGYQTMVTKRDLYEGCVKYPYHPNKYGGFIGEGNYNLKYHRYIYIAWILMLERAGSNDIFCKKDSTRYIAYLNCSVCMEWYNFQNFATWYEPKIKSLNSSYKYQIDKDLYQWNYDYKIYSPNTCTLLPENLNKSLSTIGRRYNRKRNDLPNGVCQESNNCYSASINYTGSVKILGYSDDPLEAFEIYKYNREKLLKEQAMNYYNNGALFKEDLDIIMRIDIQPYSNPLLKPV